MSVKKVAASRDFATRRSPCPPSPNADSCSHSPVAASKFSRMLLTWKGPSCSLLQLKAGTRRYSRTAASVRALPTRMEPRSPGRVGDDHPRAAEQSLSNSKKPRRAEAGRLEPFGRQRVQNHSSVSHLPFTPQRTRFPLDL